MTAKESMSATVEILTGVAGSGKTAQLLRAYRAALAGFHEDGRPNRTLWLAPTHRACRAVRVALVSDDFPVCFAPNVFTFDAFAERVLQASNSGIAPLSDVAKRTVLRRIVARLAGQGQLTYFSPIAHTVGFLDVLTRFLAELKRNETWPEHFALACRSRGESRKDRELALIYRCYQDELLRLSLYDAEGRFWSARAALENGQRAPFEQLSFVVVDGFTDFTHTQYEILKHLAKRVDRLSISLPIESPLVRDDLFAKSAAASERIERMAQSGVSLKTSLCRREAERNRPAFEHIAEHLFANPRTVRRLACADGVEILSATGQLGEVELLAGRVKRLLLDGVPAEDVVITFRTLDDYADLVGEVFTAAGIPHWCEAGDPLLRASVVKSLFAVLQLEQEGWPFERLMGVLASNYFRPDWEELQDGRAVREVAAQLRHWKLHSQRSAMLKTLRRQAERTAANEQPDNEQAAGESGETEKTAGPAAALAVLERLSQATARLRGKNDFATWAEILVSLCRDLGIVPATRPHSPSEDDEKLRRRDLRIWSRFERILFDAAAIDRLLESPGETLTLSEFTARLAELLRTGSVPPEADEAGRVRVLDAAQVRNIDVPHLFLAGLTETSFPRSRTDDCFYGEADRRQLNEQGLDLGQRTSHGQDEMLMFYGVVTRARQSLVLSYPAVSASGEPLFPSPYLTALTDLFEPGAFPDRGVIGLDPVPPRDRMLRAADLRLVATLEARRNEPGWFRAMSELPATSAAARNVLAAIDMAVERFQTRGFTAYEGVFEVSENLGWLRRRYPDQYEFSATQLEAYASCPFRFFVSDVLKIDPLESPEVVTDYRRRGVLVHEVLAALHSGEIDSATGSPLVSSAGLVERFREIVERELNRRATDSDLQQALTAIEGELLSEWASAYGDQFSDYLSAFDGAWDSPPTPVCLETPFGDVPGEPDDRQDAAPESLVFGPEGQQVRVRGRIDRIDVGTSEGRTVFNVIDYKTGAPPRFSLDDVRSGRAIQLALYTLAVQRLSLAGVDAVPFQMGYWSIKENGFALGLKTRGRSKLAPLDAAVLESLETMLDELIPRLAAAIRGGCFPVYNTDVNCTKTCPYNTVCRVSEVRRLEEALNKRPEIPNDGKGARDS